jgi:hypothetical protein
MKTLDLDGDGEVSHEEFVKGTKMDSSVRQKLGLNNKELVFSFEEHGAKITDMPPDFEDTIFQVPSLSLFASLVCVCASDLYSDLREVCVCV